MIPYDSIHLLDWRVKENDKRTLDLPWMEEMDYFWYYEGIELHILPILYFKRSLFLRSNLTFKATLKEVIWEGKGRVRNGEIDIVLGFIELSWCGFRGSWNSRLILSSKVHDFLFIHCFILFKIQEAILFYDTVSYWVKILDLLSASGGDLFNWTWIYSSQTKSVTLIYLEQIGHEPPPLFLYNYLISREDKLTSRKESRSKKRKWQQLRPRTG